jgi:hypothetical protein
MSVEDFRINASVRQVLSRFWVDLQALRFGAVGRVVYLHGRFEKMRPPEPAQSETFQTRRPEWISENLVLLDAVEKEIRREHLVTDVVFRLDNFRKNDGKWISLGA